MQSALSPRRHVVAHRTLVVLGVAVLVTVQSINFAVSARIAAPAPTQPAMLSSASLADWLTPASLKYQGLLLARRPFWSDCQADVDRDVEWQRITVSSFRGREGFGDFSVVAEELLSQVSLARDVCSAVQADIRKVGGVVGRLCPWSRKLDFKLERIGENSCPRWHCDNYAARAIISYNSAATLYTHDDNVNFWQLENGGTNECIIKDASRCRSVRVGDVLFMKGRKFPSSPKSLVHRSPEKRYRNGKVLHRLVLKVDVP